MIGEQHSIGKTIGELRKKPFHLVHVPTASSCIQKEYTRKRKGEIISYK